MFSHIFQTVKYEIAYNKYWICIPNSNSRGISPELIIYLVHSTRQTHTFCFLLSLCHQVHESQSWFPHLRCLIHSEGHKSLLTASTHFAAISGSKPGADLVYSASCLFPAFLPLLPALYNSDDHKQSSISEHLTMLCPTISGWLELYVNK